MRTPLKRVAWLLPFLLTGCFHKTQQAQNQQPLAPPIVDTPLPAPQTSSGELPPPVVTTPAPAQPPAQTAPPAKQEEKPPKKPVHHPKPDVKQAEQQQASNGAPGVSAIGQLTPGDSSDLRSQTEQSLNATEQGLKGINRELNDQEQKTVAQIREFLKQARTALTSGDIDGAHTLAVKAKVLLGEIRK